MGENLNKEGAVVGFLSARRLGARFAAGAAALATAVSMLSVPMATSAAAADSAAESTYIVLFNQGASSKDAASAVASAGGTLVANYQQIGVVVAR